MTARGALRVVAGELAAGLAPILVLLSLWFAAYVLVPSNTLLRSPVEALGVLVQPAQAAEILTATSDTLTMLAMGYVISLSVAVLLALVVTSHPLLDRAVSPVALLVGVVPVVVITPLVILVLGRGPATSVAVCVLITFFSSFVSLVSGMRSVSPTMLDVAAVLGSSAWRTVWRVRLPSAVPHLLSATKLALPAALSGVILTEYIATGRGIGTFINYARANFHYLEMWAGIVAIVLASTVVYVVIGTLEVLLAVRFTPERAGART